MIFLKEKLGRNKTILANFFASIYDPVPLVDLSLFVACHRVGIIWGDRICPNDYQLCLVGNKFRI